MRRKEEEREEQIEPDEEPGTVHLRVLERVAKARATASVIAEHTRLSTR